MNLKEKYTNWVKTLTPYNDEKVYVWLAPAGLGDKLSNLPAFRHLKKMYPDKKIVLYTEPLCLDLWQSCKYIDVVIPEGYIRGESALNITDNDIGIKAFWSFLDHHQKHICASSVEYICNVDYTDDIPLEYELDIWERDLEKIQESKNELLELANGKPIVAIAPAYTMYSRMWSRENWSKLVNLLHNQGYFVVALGGNNDLKVENIDLNKCAKYPIRHVPRILDIFDCLFTLNSGLLHLGSVNQKVPIVYISVGQFPWNIIAPYRNGKLGGGPDKMLVIDHDCAVKDECFKNHIEETGINKQAQAFIDTWKRENNEDFVNDGLLQKYICWNYCHLVLGKYRCSKLITPQRVIKEFLSWKQ
jgi:hypothetical protein